LIKICALSVVKNESAYVQQSVRSALKNNDVTMIIIDDNSSDGTYEILLELKNEFIGRLEVRRNKAIGKIAAYRSMINSVEASHYIFLDGDDFLTSDWYSSLPELCKDRIYFHNLMLFFKDGKTKSLENPKIHLIDKMKLIQSLILIPKACWIVPAQKINDFMDIPKGVEFEDFWFGLTAYRSALRIEFLPQKIYYYRQHENQLHGQQDQASKELLKFRYTRIYNSLLSLEVSHLELYKTLFFSVQKYRVLLEGNGISIFFNLGPKLFTVHFLSLYAPRLLFLIKSFIRNIL
jgi:glycosyltransferase involved in cell wall biosynthesis